jgi:hypothetical protein
MHARIKKTCYVSLKKRYPPRFNLALRRRQTTDVRRDRRDISVSKPLKTTVPV